MLENVLEHLIITQSIVYEHPKHKRARANYLAIACIRAAVHSALIVCARALSVMPAGLALGRHDERLGHACVCDKFIQQPTT